MQTVIFNPNVYRFLYLVNRLFPDNDVLETVLDCGAGGKIPPLGLFKQHGFKTHGIDISEEQLENVKSFEESHDIELNVQKADMTEIPFTENMFGYIYSQNSIFHLTKEDTRKAMKEMKRVLKPGGFMYVNFLSIEDQGCGEGEEVADGEWKAEEHGEPTVHSYYADDEPDQYFTGIEILLKEKRIIDFKMLDRKMVTLEYIGRKEA